MDLSVNSQPWQAKGVCTKMNAEIWFKKGKIPLAKSLCRQCEVLAICHDWILELEKSGATATRQGVYAAMAPADRRKIIWCMLKGCQNRVKKRNTWCSEEHKAIHQEALHKQAKQRSNDKRKDNPKTRVNVS